MWNGRLPFDKLPQVHDPSTGWIQNCNTAAPTVTSGLTMKGSDFPPGTIFGHYAGGRRVWRGRGDRASEVLPAAPRSSPSSSASAWVA